jgi:hypothetical protein
VAWRLATTEPHTTTLRLIRAATLVAAGLLLITKPLAALQVAVTLAGAYLLFQGLAIVGFRGEGKRGMYLCHSFCALGATPLADGLDDIHQFLVTHPGEIVMVVDQDYVTPPTS